MKKNVISQIFIGLLLTSAAAGQVTQHSMWLASFNTIKLSKKISLHAECQIRSTDDAASVQTLLPRVGINYHVKSNQTLTAGYAYVLNRATIGEVSSLLGEHRIWQQFVVIQPLSKSVSIQHRFRLEERFLPVGAVSNNTVEKTGTVYVTRLRYFLRGIIPLVHQAGAFEKGVFAALQNEIFVNVTDQQNVNGQFFDQNRFYAAVGYRVSKKFDLELGYLNQYTNSKATKPDVSNHILQLATYTRL